LSGGTPDSEMTVPGTESMSGYGPGATTAQGKGMYKPIRILLQTTIPTAEDDWHISRLSLLRDHPTSLSDSAGRPPCEVTARDRGANTDGDDEMLSRPDTTNYDELWLFAVDAGDGLTAADCDIRPNENGAANGAPLSVFRSTRPGAAYVTFWGSWGRP
jgi:hypothetical protein